MVGVLASAVAGGAVVSGVVGAPSVVGVSNHFAGVSEERTTIATELVVNNPNPVGASLGDVSVSYAVDMNDVRLATGGKEGLAVESGNSTVALETDLLNERIPAWWVAHLQDGEQSEVVVHATVTSGTLDESVDAPKVRETVDTDIASSFNSTETRPVEADQPGIQDPVVYVNETSGWWGTVTDEQTTVEMRFEVYNPKPYAIPVQEVQYDVDMNTIDVGEGSTDRSYVVPAGGTRTVAAQLTIQNERLDDWWVSHLQRNQMTDLEMELSLVLDLSNAGGPTVPVPFDTVEHTIDTDIFGNKAQYPTGEGNGDSDGSTSDGDDASGGDGTTATPTATSTADDPFGTDTEVLNDTDV
jgi:LEA14-like dessication related protein